MLVDPLTTRQCQIERPLSAIPPPLKEHASVTTALNLPECHSNVSESTPPFQLQQCLDAGGGCNTAIDAYYILSGMCAIIGVLYRAVPRGL